MRKERIRDLTTRTMLWPPLPSYTLVPLTLPAAPMQSSFPEIWAPAVQLIRLADAVAALQTDSGRFIDEASARYLFERSSALLMEIASAIDDEQAATTMRTRAAELVGASPPGQAPREFAAQDPDLLVMCGPMLTWGSKTRALLHSALVAVANDHIRESAAAVDEFAARAGEALASVLGLPGLDKVPAPAFVTATLVACGGEAAGVPKHFAYFLPADEGSEAKSGPTKTLVFSNVHAARLDQISSVLFASAARPADEASARAKVTLDASLGWFRCHDISHMWRSSETDLAALERLGHFRSMTLQEAAADVFGLLLAAQEDLLGLRPEDVVATMLAEMLRYVRRGVGYFADSVAAYLELSYLLENGFVKPYGEGGFSWTVDGVVAGMSSLAHELAAIAIFADVEAGRRLLAAYGPDGRCAAHDDIDAMMRVCDRAPHDVFYQIGVQQRPR